MTIRFPHLVMLASKNTGWGDLPTWASVALTFGMLAPLIWALRKIANANQWTPEVQAQEQTRQADADATLRRQATAISAHLIGYDRHDDHNPGVEIINRSTGPVFNVEVRLLSRDIKLRDVEGGQQWLDQAVTVTMRDAVVTTPMVRPGVQPQALEVEQWPTVREMHLEPPENPTKSKALYRQLTENGEAFAAAMSVPGNPVLQPTDFLDSHPHASAAVTHLFEDFVRSTLHTYADGRPYFASGRLVLTFTDENNQRWERGDGGVLVHLGSA